MPKSLLNVQFSFGEERLTHFAGIVLIHRFCGKLGVKRLFQRRIRFHPPRTRYAVADLLMAMIYTLIMGIGRFTNSRILKYNGSFQTLVGLRSFPDPTTLQRRLKTVPPKVIRQIVGVHDQLREKLWTKLMAGRTSLVWDLDSTVLTVYGDLEGARVGYNPTKPGRRSYHPLICTEAHSKTIWHGSFRPGNLYTGAGVVGFLTHCLRKVPKGVFRIRVRGDSGFFNNRFLTFLEGKSIGYAIVAKLTPRIKKKLAGQSLRYQKDRFGWEFAEFRLDLMGWKVPRRFAVVRRPIPVDPAEKKQLTLWTFKKHAYHVVVTNLTLRPMRVWRFYSQRAALEGEIKELKRDFALNKIPTNHFLANLLYFHLQLLSFNMVSWFVQLCLPKAFRSWTLHTLRLNLLVLPGRLVRAKGRNILRLPQGYEYKPLWFHADSKIDKLKITNL